MKNEALKPSNTCGAFANGALLIDELRERPRRALEHAPLREFS